MGDSATKTILFIDDDPIVLMAYRTCLVQAGFHVEPARDGVEIMGFIRGNPKLKNTPVIVLSTHSIIDAEGEPMLETAHCRLIKETCTPASILETIQDALANARAI